MGSLTEGIAFDLGAVAKILVVAEVAVVAGGVKKTWRLRDKKIKEIPRYQEGELAVNYADGSP